MIGINEQHHAKSVSRQARIVSSGEHPFYVAYAPRGAAFFNDGQHFRLNIDGIDCACITHQFSHWQAEVAGASADVGNTIAGFDRQVAE